MTGDSSVAATTPTMTRPVPCDYWRLGRLKSDYSTRLVRGLARAPTRRTAWFHRVISPDSSKLSAGPINSAPGRGAECCDERVCLCVRVCLSAIIFSQLHVRSSASFLCMLRMAVARSSSGGVVIRYVLPVLWTTSYLLVSQGCSTSPPSWSAVHTQPWAWLQTVRSDTGCRPTDARNYFSGA